MNRSSNHLRAAVPATLLALSALSLMAGTAFAATRHAITRGDVTAAFQARTTGGYRNMVNGNQTAAPVVGLHDGRINFFSDAIYCASDWHYLGVTVLEEGGRATAAPRLAASTTTFRIDGRAVGATMRSAIKPFVGTGIHGQWGVSVGKLIPPGSIADGPHTLETTIRGPEGTDILTVTFELSSAGCG